ncbi:MAG: T9SS type A sorting domain-containing protein [Balneolales bacterium]|nr:T9SS type A sorting domain-containing protein [Balneolales bacterium]
MVASAQFTFDEVFPADSTAANSHGIAIDAENKVWSGPYYSSLINDGAERINPVYVYNPDGTQTDFSPLKGSVTADTLLRFGPVTGVSSSIDGNIYVSSHGFRMTASESGAVVGGVWNQSRSFIHKFDATTGEALNVIEVTYLRDVNVTHAPNRPAVSEEGYVAVSFVFPASPIIILDSNDNYDILTTVTDDKLGFSRTLEISADGTMIFNPNTEPYTEGGAPGHIEVWTADSVFDEYVVSTPLATGSDPGAIARYPGTDIVFATGGGSGNGPLSGTSTMFNRYYGYSLNSGQVVSHFDWNYASESQAIEVPRALAFSADGLTAYIGSFSQTGNGAIQRFTAPEPVSIERTAEVVTGFALSQNYPNPFNPTTNINYTLAEAGFATIRVYDVLGRVVSTLVNQEMPAGQHTVSFNAANLSSGVYLYELSVGNVRLTNTMTLMK